MPVNFTAIDFETANRHSASACAVGLARVRDGKVVATASWLIRPPDEYSEFEARNIEIHGIHPEDVRNAPAWSEQLDSIAAFTGADVLVAHNAGFDMAVLRRACAATGQDCPPYRYLCSVQVARQVYTLPSYRLPVAAAEAGFTDFHHHDPADDALASAHIIIDAAARVAVDNVVSLARSVGVRIGQIPTAEDLLAATA